MEQPVVDIARVDLDAIRDLCAELLATVKAQEQRIAELEARPQIRDAPATLPGRVYVE